MHLLLQIDIPATIAFSRTLQGFPFSFAECVLQWSSYVVPIQQWSSYTDLVQQSEPYIFFELLEFYISSSNNENLILLLSNN